MNLYFLNVLENRNSKAVKGLTVHFVNKMWNFAQCLPKVFIFK